MQLTDGLLVRIKGDSRSVEKAFKKGGISARQFGITAATALAAVTAASVKMAAQLDHDLRLTATLYNGTSKDIEAMRQNVKGLSREFGISQRQFAKANYQVVSAGFKGINKELAIMRAGAKLAVVGNADLVGSTEAVAKAIKAFGIEAKDADKAAAQLWGITRDGLITVEGLNRFLKELPSAAAASGISFTQLSGTLSLLTGVTGSAEKSMDFFRSVLIKTSTLGIEGDFLDRIAQLKDITGGDLQALMEVLQDQGAALGAQTLIHNFDALAEVIEKADKVSRDFADGGALMSESATTKFAKAQQELNAIMLDFGASILPAVVAALDKSRSAIDSVVAGIQEWRRVTDQSLVPFNTVGTLPNAIIAARNWLDVDPGLLPPLGARPGIMDPTGPAFPPRASSGAGGGGPIYTGRGIGPMTAQEYLNAQGAPFAWQRPFGPENGASRFYPAGLPGTLHREESAAMDRAFAESGAGGAIPDDELDNWIDAMNGVGESAESAALKAGAANIAVAGMAGLVGGALISAFGKAESAMGAFVQSMLIQFAQLGTRAAMSSLFPGLGLLSLQSGGFTGFGNPSAIAGVVHREEYVLPKSVVDAIGRHRLDDFSQRAQGGVTIEGGMSINVTGGNDPNATARAVNRSVSEALRQANRTGTASLHEPASLG